MKKITSLVLALVMCLSLCATAFAAYGETGDDSTDADVTWNFTGADEDLNQLDEILPLVTKFDDVKSGAWFYNDVMECAKLGIVQGFEDGKFHPDESVTAVQFIVMLTRTFYNDKVEAAKATNNSSWYAPNLAAAKSLKTSMVRDLTIDDKAMNRYDMAMALFNVLTNENKCIVTTSTEFQNAKTSIKDWNNIPVARKGAVPQCYALGIITGMDDKCFHGEQSMTRAQACTVIMRMMKLIKNYNPGDRDNEQYDDGQNQNQQLLTNGKPANVENVVAMLKDIERQYPAGTLWGDSNTPNTNWYKAGPRPNDTSRDIGKINATIKSSANGNISLQLACGGWACMVSETVFGKTGAPCRELTSFNQARPGDILYTINKETGYVKHVSIIIATNVVNGKTVASVCDAGGYNGTVAWNWTPSNVGPGSSGTMTNSAGNIQYRLFTRY